MTDQERVDEIEERYPSGNVDADDVRELLAIVRQLQGVVDQQAGWLREVTLERDALKLRVAELERERDEGQSLLKDAWSLYSATDGIPMDHDEDWSATFNRVWFACLALGFEYLTPYQQRWMAEADREPYRTVLAIWRKRQEAELDQKTLPNCPNCNHPSWACRRCGHWE